MPAKRAVRDFDVSADPWPAIESWATSQGYKRAESAGDRRSFKKGTGFLTASRILEVAVHGGHVHLEAWVHANLVARIAALFLIPTEMTVESGGFRGALPRKLGRDEINPLLQAMGQPPLG